MPSLLYAVSQNAFAPYEPMQLDDTSLNLVLGELYGRLPCYVHADPQYKTQLSTLIDALANVVLADEFNLDREHVVTEVQLLKAKLEDTSYVSDNPQVQKAYYETYKKNLETIFCLINDWDEIKKGQFIRSLGERIMVCATGAYTQLAEILFELTEKPSINSWLAGLRKNILYQFSEDWILNNHITDSNSIHVHYFCYDYAQASGWNIPGVNLISGYSDERFQPAALNSTTQNELKRYFETQYTYQAMNKNIFVNFNLLLSPYYNVLLTPDDNTSICSILEPFIQHDIFDMNAIYTYDDGEWRIKPDFQANLPKYIHALLLKENIIISNVPTIVNNEMIPLLAQEIERLKRKYGGVDNRIQLLENTVAFLLQTIARDESTDYLSEISAHINEVYLNKSIDKYSSFAKIGICLLNMLMILPLGIAGAIKYATTGNFFFSMRGKSCELIDTIRHEVSCLTNLNQF